MLESYIEQIDVVDENTTSELWLGILAFLIQNHLKGLFAININGLVSFGLDERQTSIFDFCFGNFLIDRPKDGNIKPIRSQVL